MKRCCARMQKPGRRRWRHKQNVATAHCGIHAWRVCGQCWPWLYADCQRYGAATGCGSTIRSWSVRNCGRQTAYSIESSHAQGRELIVHGVYFKLLSLVFPLQPLWYYLASYVIHICAIGLAAWVVWRATKSALRPPLRTDCRLSFTGREVFLTLLKQELQMTLCIIVALLLLQRLMQPDRFRLGGTLAALAAATFLSGTLGKENFVIRRSGCR